MRFLLAAALVALATVRAEPTGIPSPAEAKQQLAGLTITFFFDKGDYDRDAFGGDWNTVKDKCDTRETVLQRDGKDVKTDDQCGATSGTWYSPYDGKTLKKAEDVDIDHMVPLKNAWINGASKWTDAEREDFANDLVRPQLWAVSASANRQKSDQGPDEWRPDLKEVWCDYASSYIAVKSHYGLTTTEDEHDALDEMLGECTESNKGSGDSDSDSDSDSESESESTTGTAAPTSTSGGSSGSTTTAASGDKGSGAGRLGMMLASICMPVGAFAMLNL